MQDIHDTFDRLWAVIITLIIFILITSTAIIHHGQQIRSSQHQIDQLFQATTRLIAEKEPLLQQTGLAAGRKCTFLLGYYGKGIAIVEHEELDGKKYRTMFHNVSDAQLEEWGKNPTFRW